MVRMNAATISMCLLACVAITAARPISSRAGLEDSNDIFERGAFGRLGSLLRPLISGHLKANNAVRRDIDTDGFVKRGLGMKVVRRQGLDITPVSNNGISQGSIPTNPRSLVDL
ncbi:hypothetical protein BKA70DRAFT_1327135, partial [Coprinopsis sp. MPI-PUGE-AT-0042]